MSPDDRPLSAMILAAGRGERMRPLTDTLPKPLLPVAGKPLIEYHLEKLAGLGLQRVVINHAWLGAKIEAALGDGSRWGLDLVYSPEPEGALETGGAIFQALPLLGEGPFLVLNGDVWSDCDLGALRIPAGSLAHLLLVPNPEHNPGGDFSLQQGRLGCADTDTLTFSGIGIYRRELIAGCTGGRFPLAPLLRRAARGGRATGEHLAGQWVDVGTPQRLQSLDEALRERNRHQTP